MLLKTDAARGLLPESYPTLALFTNQHLQLRFLHVSENQININLNLFKTQKC